MKRGRLQKQNKTVDRNLLFLILTFIVLGLIAVADASAPQSLNSHNDKFYLLKQQSISAVIGIVLLLTVSKINYKFWEKVATPLFFVSIALLIIVLIPGVGSKLLGARRWISVGFINFQPSELIKLAMAMYLAKVASVKKGAASFFIPIGVVLGLIMLQPDLGTAMIVAIIGLSQIFISGINMLYFMGGGIVGGILTFLLIILSPYRKDRLLTYFEMTEDPLGKGYHIRQVLLGLGSGGLFGVGIGQSRQKYLFLPEASTDSIFSIILEELGFLGGVVLIFMFLYFIFRGLRIVKNAPDDFSRVLALGIVAWLGGQAFLNMAAMTALLPLTGIPLPFFSYGGSSLVMVLVSCGILLNISKHTTYG